MLSIYSIIFDYQYLGLPVEQEAGLEQPQDDRQLRQLSGPAGGGPSCPHAAGTGPLSSLRQRRVKELQLIL